MTKLYTLGLFSLSLATFVACGKGNGTSPHDDSSSSSTPSFKSSSSFSDRADIDYKGEVLLDETMRVNVEFFTGDSIDMDSSETYIDSGATSIPLYLGYLPKGSRIKIAANIGNMENDKIFVKSESGEYLSALTPVKKNKSSEDSIFVNYFVPSFGASSDSIFRDSNEFVVFTENHYFVEVNGDFNNKSTFRLRTTIDTAYFDYTGDATDITMKTTDTIRGIIPIDNAPDSIGVKFSSAEGFSVNLNAQGTNIDSLFLKEGKDTLCNYGSSMDTLLVPNESTSWTLQVSPTRFSNYQTGPFAFFTAATKSRALEQGEYFTKPDSIKVPGEVFLRTRPKDDNEFYKYNLRQEQYLWIGDFKKGDSIVVKHGIYNYSEDISSPVTLEILDKNQKKQGTINAAYGSGFSITKDMPEGPYYLHYLRLNSQPSANVRDSLRYVLQLHTLVQHIGSVETMEMVNVEDDGKTFDIIYQELGSKIALDKFVFLMEPSKEKGWSNVSDNVNWFVPCSSLSLINTNYTEKACKTNPNEEQQIFEDYLDVLNVAENVGETALLIAESVADPAKRDTLSIYVMDIAD